MNEKKYSKMLTVILIIIIVAVIGLLGFLGYSYCKNYIINTNASEYVDSFEQQVVTDTPETSEEPVVSTNTTDNQANELSEVEVQETENKNTSTSSSKKKTTYNGFEVLGTIEIPKTDLKYPVLAKLSSKALDTAVVAIYPANAELNKPGNVVIAGHNYRNGLFFSNNKKLSTGDKIYITDLEGNKVTYVIYNIFEASDTDTESYSRDTEGRREITLSTCTDDSSARLIIEAKEE